MKNPFKFPKRPSEGFSHSVMFSDIEANGLTGATMEEFMKTVPEGWMWASTNSHALRFKFYPSLAARQRKNFHEKNP